MSYSDNAIQTVGAIQTIYFWDFFFCDPKITAFLKIKLLVSSFFFVRQSVRIQTNCQTGCECYSDKGLLGPLMFGRQVGLFDAANMGVGVKT